jgi:hypothetical protein
VLEDVCQGDGKEGEAKVRSLIHDPNTSGKGYYLNESGKTKPAVTCSLLAVKNLVSLFPKFLFGFGDSFTP